MIKLRQQLPQKMEINSAAEHAAGLMFHLFENAPKPVRPMTKHLASASGKGVRTSLLLTSAMDEEGLVPKDTILAGVAIEVFHLATLIHDDIIDNADTRRGIPSLHVEFSKKQAVICGDYLMCMALSAVSTIYEPYKDFVEQFTSAIEKVCLGELRQHSNHNNTDISFYEYLRTIHGKTAALFHISAYSGALIGGCSDKELKQMGKLGTYFGMIFQILDDCKDYMLSDSEALKPTKTDIAAGVVNLPLLMAFLKEPELRNIAKRAIGNPIEAGKLINDVCRLEGVSSSIAVVEKYEKKAANILNNISNKRKAEELGKVLAQQMKIARSFK